MKELLVVGAAHLVAVDAGTMFGATELHEVDPPYNLVEKLAMQQGALVGVELPRGLELNPENTADDDEAERLFNRQRLFKGEHLFSASKKLLEAEGCEVVGIDSPELDARKVEIALEIERLVNKQYRREHHELVRYPLSAKNQQKLGVLRAELAHIDHALREETMYDNIAELKPDAVLIGGAHADRLILDTNLQRRLGVVVHRYAHLNPTETRPRVVSSRIVVPSMENIKLQHDRQDFEREIARRHYLAYTAGRISVDAEAQPDFIGAWSNFAEPPVADGLFELTIAATARTEDDYMVVDEFVGIVRDGLGDARVVGTMGEGMIQFTKEYDLERSTHDAAGLVYYEGEFQPDGSVHGWYGFSAGYRDEMPFAMRPPVANAAHLLRKDIKAVIERDHFDPR